MTGNRRAGLSRAIGRLLQTLLVVWAAASLAFVLLRSAPGDPYAARVDSFSIPEALRERWRAQRGLDQPIAVQYVRWLRGIARGDFGWSTMHQRPVRDVLKETLPRTLLLMSLALGTSVVFGMLIGAWQGTHSGSIGDDAVSTTSLVVYSVPEFWLALLLLQLFAQTLGWLPAAGMVDAMHNYMPIGEQLRDRVRHLVLPWLVLSLVGTAVFARYQRSSMREAWQEPYVRTARAKGLADRGVRRHAWRNALVPVVTVLGLLFPALLGGAVFVERVFAWPGMGHTTVLAVSARDYEFVTAAVVVGSGMTAIGSLLADWLVQWADPRART